MYKKADPFHFQKQINMCQGSEKRIKLHEPNMSFTFILYILQRI